MKSSCTPRFWEGFNALPDEVRELATKNYALWQENPQHPSLHFKPLGGGFYSVRIGLHYRAIGDMTNDSIIWLWIGHHSEYDRLVRRL